MAPQRVRRICLWTHCPSLTTGLALLAYKIWTVERDARKTGIKRAHSSLWPVLLVIIESGALYTAILIVALVTAIHALHVEYVINSFVSTSLLECILTD